MWARAGFCALVRPLARLKLSAFRARQWPVAQAVMRNSDGLCIPDPSSGGGGAPAGATAQCRDGDYSYSTHHSGTCSGHGGVSQWLTS
jgi:hypothetical protein